MINIKAKKKFVLILIGLVFIIAGTIIYIFYIYKSEPELTLEKIEYRKELVYKFIEDKMTSPSGGIYTNYLTDKVLEYDIKGNYILSETIGLTMKYAIIEKDLELFDRQFCYLNNYMITDSGFIPWYVQAGGKNKSFFTSTIDDIRIAEQLIKAYEIWGKEKYIRKASEAIENILKYEISDLNLINYYNWKEDEKSNRIKLVYIDPGALELFSKINSKFKQIKTNGEKTLSLSPDSRFPFYRKTYNYLAKQFEQSSEVNIINLLLTALNCSKTGVSQTDLVNWLEEEMRENNKVYGKYNYHSGVPAVDYESIAGYAIGVRLGLLEGNIELTQKFMYKLLSFQDLDKESPTYGGFVFTSGGESYSFDNLQAMISLAVYANRLKEKSI